MVEGSLRNDDRELLPITSIHKLRFLLRWPIKRLSFSPLIHRRLLLLKRSLSPNLNDDVVLGPRRLVPLFDCSG